MTESKARASARERILQVLGTTERPLRWAELTDALGGLTDEARTECEWLMDHGYIAPIRSGKRGRRAEDRSVASDMWESCLGRPIMPP